jgi:putative transposase
MQFYPYTFYHLYNRTNNNELLFKEDENYFYFLKQFKKRFQNLLDTIGYCLMPTHFHFFVRTKSEGIETLPDRIGIWLSAYTKAVNIRSKRHGCLFQRHTKAIPVTDEKYLLTLMTYIHQNPLRAGLATRLEEWPYSSYLDYAGLRDGTILKKEWLAPWFSGVDEFIAFTNDMIKSIDQKVWV